jgi:hypothetical protein
MMLIQIVPALPPATNGVGDYALAVGRVMRAEYGVDSLFVVAGQQWEGPEEIEGFRVRKVAARTSQALAQGLESACAESGSSSVLLQLSPYGYSRRGAPLWLQQGLKQWKQRWPEAQLVTMFHELYVSAPPWRHLFWMSLLQRLVVAGIARQSDAAVTNIQLHRERLERLDPGKRGKIQVLAVPSNVGEPSQPGELTARCRNLVVFGQPGMRKHTYEGQMAALRRACEQLEITEIHDIGGAYDGIPEMVAGLPVKRHGVLEAGDLSALLSNSLAGFLDYPPTYLAKSGVFAAYCAHRLVPLIPATYRDCRPWTDGIAGATHYLKVDGKRGTETLLTGLQPIADAAWGWYHGHTLKEHARAFAAAVQREDANRMAATGARIENASQSPSLSSLGNSFPSRDSR